MLTPYVYWSLTFIRGFGQGHGFAQIVVLIALEAITAVSECPIKSTASHFRIKVPLGLFYWHPYYSKGYNLVNYLLQTSKVISHTLLILFIPSFNFNVSGAQVYNLASTHCAPGHCNHYHRHYPPCSELNYCVDLDRFNHPQDGYESVLVPIFGCWTEPFFAGWGILWYRLKHHGFESRKDQHKWQCRIPSGTESVKRNENDLRLPPHRHFSHSLQKSWQALVIPCWTSKI